MRKQAILCFKGGVGKTTIAVNLADALRRKGKRVLLVDCDFQGNASSILPEITYPTLTQVIMQQAPISAAIREARPGLDLLPSDRSLDTASAWIISQGRRAYFHFKASIDSLAGYDVILYDLAPSYSQVAEAVLLASDELLVPCELAPYAVEGLLSMLQKLEENLIDHPLIIRGIVPSMLDHRYAMTGQYLTQIQSIFQERVTPAIRTDAAIPRAQAFHQTIFEYDETNKTASRSAQDFDALAAHLFAEARAHA